MVNEIGGIACMMSCGKVVHAQLGQQIFFRKVSAAYF